MPSRLPPLAGSLALALAACTSPTSPPAASGTTSGTADPPFLASDVVSALVSISAYTGSAPENFDARRRRGRPAPRRTLNGS